MTWKKLIENDLSEISHVDPKKRNNWRSGVRSAMVQLASYLDVDDAPAPAC